MTGSICVEGGFSDPFRVHYDCSSTPSQQGELQKSLLHESYQREVSLLIVGMRNTCDVDDAPGAGSRNAPPHQTLNICQARL